MFFYVILAEKILPSPSSSTDTENELILCNFLQKCDQSKFTTLWCTMQRFTPTPFRQKFWEINLSVINHAVNCFHEIFFNLEWNFVSLQKFVKLIDIKTTCNKLTIECISRKRNIFQKWLESLCDLISSKIINFTWIAQFS